MGKGADVMSKKTSFETWLNNIEELATTGKAGRCPYCSSSSVDFGYVEVGSSGYGYGCIWCDKCKHAIHLDRVKISELKDLGKEIPNGLIYI